MAKWQEREKEENKPEGIFMGRVGKKLMIENISPDQRFDRERERLPGMQLLRAAWRGFPFFLHWNRVTSLINMGSLVGGISFQS